jgi:hypothetical protein
MTLTPNHKRLAIGLWVLAALLVLWYNAVAFLSLWDRELTAMSPGARATIAKRQQLESRMAQKLLGVIDPLQINHIAAKIDGRRVVPPPKPIGGTPVQAVVKKVKPAPKVEVKLPSLDGIIAVYHPSKGKTYLAVMDGKTLEERSGINDFVIQSIDAKGVLLARGAKAVFIPAPQIAYSKDKSMEE